MPGSPRRGAPVFVGQRLGDAADLGAVGRLRERAELCLAAADQSMRSVSVSELSGARSCGERRRPMDKAVSAAMAVVKQKFHGLPPLVESRRMAAPARCRSTQAARAEACASLTMAWRRRHPGGRSPRPGGCPLEPVDDAEQALDGGDVDLALSAPDRARSCRGTCRSRGRRRSRRAGSGAAARASAAQCTAPTIRPSSRLA